MQCPLTDTGHCPECLSSGSERGNCRCCYRGNACHSPTPFCPFHYSYCSYYYTSTMHCVFSVHGWWKPVIQMPHRPFTEHDALWVCSNTNSMNSGKGRRGWVYSSDHSYVSMPEDSLSGQYPVAEKALLVVFLAEPASCR